ncbi:MAG: FHIPEP family type III secretion protein [Treponema sp.]|nr:FHIPEP family type III secretion protein [Treponema sp.]
MKGFDAIQGFFRHGFLAIMVIIIILLILIPIPTLALDILIGLNFLIALIILSIVLCIKKATSFTLLPSIALVSTVFCMIVNVCAARLILIKGADFDGWLIRYISSLLVGPNKEYLVVGLIIYLVIATIFVKIILKGITRVVEVAARFTLDILPGKQMAIDAEFSSGIIDQNEAVLRKEALQQESDFYSSLDGASKFITGNAKVGIFITLIIIIAGTLIDHLIREIVLLDAITTYLPLAISSGMLFMIPSALVGFAVANAVTKESQKDRLVMR